MKKVLIILSLLTACKKKEPECYLIQTETTTVWKENSKNFYRYGKDNTDIERGFYVECNLLKVDSLRNLGEIQPINGIDFCMVIHRVITKNKKD